MSGAMPRVIVTHPGRQHSHQAAMALEKAGMLAGYWAGVPSREKQQGLIPRALRRRLHRYGAIDIADERARWLPIAVVLRRLSLLLPQRAAQLVDFIACRLFDRHAARGLAGAGASIVVCCEISALETFRAAKRLGMTTVLDAASVHNAVQDRVTPIPESPWLHHRIVRTKDAEIALADHILTVSQLAREGYVAAGVPEARVHAVVLGADTRLFNPGPELERDLAGPCTFMFSGATLHRKGIDTLVRAFQQVRRARPGRARLVIVGPEGDRHELVRQALDAEIVFIPSVTQSRLVRFYREADCFVLPSRHDSFGMVVVEAMACGVPAIVSDMVGAREAIEEGRSGWIVPRESDDALAERMTWCVDNRAALASMRPHARACAERYGWDRYGERLAQVMGAIASKP